MAHYSQTPKDLAQTIAAAFGKEEQIKLYQHIRRLHDPTIVKRAFDKVQDMPTARFMESRSSLFLYLLGNYVHDENQTPKCELGAKHEGCAFSEDVEIADVGNMTIRQAL